MARTSGGLWAERYNVAITERLAAQRESAAGWRNVLEEPGGLMFAVKGLFMEKWMCWGSMGVAGFLLLMFLIDMILGFPFGGVSIVVDIFGLLASGLVLFLAYDAFKDLR